MRGLFIGAGLPDSTAASTTWPSCTLRFEERRHQRRTFRSCNTCFVYGVVISLFLFFNSFALVQWLQYKQIGRFADYLVGERLYITLSFVAKSALAWQLFAGVLAANAGQ